jgi:hypothetical protein
VDHFTYHLILENKIADQYPVPTTKLVTMPETHAILSKVADKLAEKGSTLASKIKEQIVAKKKAVDS